MGKNESIAKGLNKFSTNKYAKMTAKWKHYGKGGKKKVEKKEEQKWYPAEDVSKPLNRNFTPKSAKLRKSITPGTVLIVLSGRFRGKRCVFLKQLKSGLLLVTGPYKVNGVPLRRLNQAYVIATSTKVDISGVKVPARVNDEYFKKPESAKGGFFAGEEPKKNSVADIRKEDQKAVDDALVAEIKKTELLSEFLAAKFSLKNGQYPHLMKF
eukprot:g4889.t1